MLKGLKAKKLKFFLNSTSIILSVAFLMGTLVLSTTLNGIFDDLFASVYKNTDVVVRNDKSIDSSFGEEDSSLRKPISFETLNKVREIKGVQGAFPGVQFFATIFDKNNEVVGTVDNGPPTLGGEWESKSTVDNFVLTKQDGSSYSPEERKQFVLKDDEVIMDRKSFDEGKFKIGDTVKIQVYEGQKEFKLVATVRFGKADSPGGVTVSLFNLKTARELSQIDGAANEIAIKAEPNVKPTSLVKTIKAKLKDDKNLEVRTGAEIGKQTAEQLKNQLSFFSIILGIFSFVSIAVAFFIISNSFGISIVQKLKELALLRAVGAKGSQVFRIVVYEAFVLGIVSSVFGIFAGIGLAKLVKTVLGSAGFVLPSSPLIINTSSYVASFIIGVLITIVASVPSGIRAAKTNPLALMREVSAEKPRMKLRFILGALILVLGAGLMIFGSDQSNIKVLGLGIGVCFVASVVLLPLLVGYITSIFGSRFYAIFVALVGIALVISSAYVLIAKVILDTNLLLLIFVIPTFFFGLAVLFSGKPAFSILGKITVENIKKSPTRSSKTAIALTIGVTLVAFISVFAASAKVSLDEYIDNSLRADFYVQSLSLIIPLNQEIQQDVAGLKGVKYSTPLIYGSVQIDSKSEFVTGVDYKNADKLFKMVKDGNLNDVSKIAVSEATAKDSKMKVGDKVKVKFSSGAELDLEVGAILVKDSVTPGLTYLLDISILKKYQLQAGVSRVVIKIDDSTNAKSFYKKLEATTSSEPIVGVYDQTKIKELQSKQIDQFINVIYGLLALAIIIAGLGIINTLFLVVVERFKELGLLRAIGVTKSQVRQMLRWEATIIASIGAYVGIVLGSFFAWILIENLKDDGLSTFSLPVPTLLVIMGLSISLGTAASILPSIKASKIDTLEAISYE